MKALLITATVAAAVASGVVLAQSDVLKTKGCLGCHEMDKKKVGPAFKDVAAKYKDDKGAEAALVAKLKDGKGHMKINASEADIKAAVDQVLKAK